MTKEELFRAVGEVREDQITEAETVKKASRPWRRYGTLAACLALVLAGAFALERLEGARKWAELQESFQTADTVHPETAPEDGGGEDEDRWGALVMPFNPFNPEEAPVDGADYWSGIGKRPASNYSIGVEIAELQGGDAENEASKRNEGTSEDQAGVSSSACLAWLSPEEIFAQDTVIFRGTVRDLRYYAVESDGFEMQYTVAEVEVTGPIRGDLTAGETRTVLYMGGPDMSASTSGPLDALEAGSDAIFMPVAATPETGRQDGDSWFCYADLGEFYLSEGLRYVFLDTVDGLRFERGLYAEIAEAETLDDIADYIRGMIGEPEGARPTEAPPEPQAAPVDIDPALLDPGYGVEGANGERELPDGTVLRPEDLRTGG